LKFKQVLNQVKPVKQGTLHQVQQKISQFQFECMFQNFKKP